MFFRANKMMQILDERRKKRKYEGFEWFDGIDMMINLQMKVRESWKDDGFIGCSVFIPGDVELNIDCADL